MQADQNSRRAVVSGYRYVRPISTGSKNELMARTQGLGLSLSHTGVTLLSRATFRDMFADYDGDTLAQTVYSARQRIPKTIITAALGDITFEPFRGSHGEILSLIKADIESVADAEARPYDLTDDMRNLYIAMGLSEEGSTNRISEVKGRLCIGTVPRNEYVGERIPEVISGMMIKLDPPQIRYN